MSLITMGYGHLTIITMGLGNGVRIGRPYIIPQRGAVEFQDVGVRVEVENKERVPTLETQQHTVRKRNIGREVKYD